MIAKIRYWRRFEREGQNLVELKIHDVGKLERYPDGVKYGLICIDLKSGLSVLMDNHHPKGPHVHLPGREFAYWIGTSVTRN